MDIQLVISRLRPGAPYHFIGAGDGKDGYEAIGEWRDGFTEKPTEQECEAEWEKVLQERAAQAIIDEQARMTAIIAKQQKIELLSLPNWATWTATDAKDSVSSSITGGLTLEQCNKAIDEANSIAKLLPILKNIIRAIYAIEGVLTSMARAIIYIRDIIK